MKLYMLRCTADRYNVTQGKMREIDLDKIATEDACEIALEHAGEAYRKIEDEMEMEVAAKAWLRKTILKKFESRSWCDFMTEDGGYLFIKSGNVSFPAKTVVKICEAWGRNLVGEG